MKRMTVGGREAKPKVTSQHHPRIKGQQGKERKVGEQQGPTRSREGGGCLAEQGLDSVSRQPKPRLPNPHGRDLDKLHLVEC